jgi:hypothetical protein
MTKAGQVRYSVCRYPVMALLLVLVVQMAVATAMDSITEENVGLASDVSIKTKCTLVQSPWAMYLLVLVSAPFKFAIYANKQLKKPLHGN